MKFQGHLFKFYNKKKQKKLLLKFVLDRAEVQPGPGLPQPALLHRQ